MIATPVLTLLYDAACPVCALEMDHLRERSSDGRLAFVDIGAAGFDAAAFGVTQAELNARIHGVLPDGTLLRGMPTLRLAYATAGLGWVLAPSDWALLRPLFDRGYVAFARHRQLISRVAAPFIAAVRARRMAARRCDCGSGACRRDEGSAP